MSSGADPTRRGLLGLSAAAVAGCAATPAGGANASMGSASRASDERAELDELFADLTDQSGTVEPIAPAEYAARRTRLSERLRDLGHDAFLCEPGATMTYLSGVAWGTSERLFALVVTADGEHFWVVPAFEGPRALQRILAQAPPGAGEATLITWDEHEYAFAPTAAALRERRIERVAFDPRLRSFVREELGAAHGHERLAYGKELVRGLRGCKDAHELRLMRRACELTQQAIAAVADRLRPGMTGAEVGGWIRHAQERLGLRGTWALSLVGAEAAFPHGRDGTTQLERSGVLLIDTGGSLHGYQSDISRTWTFDGPPSTEVERVWLTVRDAQQQAFEALRPGRPCAEIDRLARRVIEDAGYGRGYESFFHRLGHGIGLEGHEEPYLDGGNELLLAEGMTFSDEPGIYLYDRFGVRIEDIVVITATGADHFGGWQRSVTHPG